MAKLSQIFGWEDAGWLDCKDREKRLGHIHGSVLTFENEMLGGVQLLPRLELALRELGFSEEAKQVTANLEQVRELHKVARSITSSVLKLWRLEEQERGGKK
jgi:hypothetical protein